MGAGALRSVSEQMAGAGEQVSVGERGSRIPLPPPPLPGVSRPYLARPRTRCQRKLALCGAATPSESRPPCREPTLCRLPMTAQAWLFGACVCISVGGSPPEPPGKERLHSWEAEHTKSKELASPALDPGLFSVALQPC